MIAACILLFMVQTLLKRVLTKKQLVALVAHPSVASVCYYTSRS